MNKLFLSSMLLVSNMFYAAANVDSPQAGQSGQVETHYEVTGRAVSLHEPVIILFTIHNGLAHPITVDLGVGNVSRFEFILKSSSGKIVHGRPQRTEGLTQQENVVIGAGEDYKQQLILNRWFDIDAPGSYELKARLNTPIDAGPNKVTPPLGETISFEIESRDVNRLKAVCERLAAEAENARGVEAAQFPTLVLSYINDPVAVPYLSKILSEHTLEYDVAILGLERVGSDAAVETLLSALNDKYGEIDVLARQALSRMQNRISNANLRETVRRALSENVSRQNPPS
jgi:hypothetical protein